jgi:hypothetical protein
VYRSGGEATNAVCPASAAVHAGSVASDPAWMVMLYGVVLALAACPALPPSSCDEQATPMTATRPTPMAPAETFRIPSPSE